jgi:hypothetical protein
MLHHVVWWILSDVSEELTANPDDGESKKLKMTTFWDIAPCNLVKVGWWFRGAYCLHQ